MTETCEKHKVERCLTCFAHVPGSAAAPDDELTALSGGHPRSPSDSRSELELCLRDAFAAGAEAAQSRSIFCAADYAKRESPIVAKRIGAAVPSGPGLREALAKMSDAAEMLWVVLANVSGGDWEKQNDDWQQAAARWRNNYFEAVTASRAALAAHPEVQPRTYIGIDWAAGHSQTVLAFLRDDGTICCTTNLLCAEHKNISIPSASPAQRTREQVAVDALRAALRAIEQAAGAPEKD